MGAFRDAVAALGVYLYWDFSGDWFFVDGAGWRIRPTINNSGFSGTFADDNGGTRRKHRMSTGANEGGPLWGYRAGYGQPAITPYTSRLSTASTLIATLQTPVGTTRVGYSSTILSHATYSSSVGRSWSVELRANSTESPWLRVVYSQGWAGSVERVLPFAVTDLFDGRPHLVRLGYSDTQIVVSVDGQSHTLAEGFVPYFEGDSTTRRVAAGESLGEVAIFDRLLSASEYGQLVTAWGTRILSGILSDPDYFEGRGDDFPYEATGSASIQNATRIATSGAEFSGSADARTGSGYRIMGAGGLSARSHAEMSPHRDPAEVGPPFQAGEQDAPGNRWLKLIGLLALQGRRVNGRATTSGSLRLHLSLSTAAVRGVSTAVGNIESAARMGATLLGTASVSSELSVAPAGQPGPIAGVATAGGDLRLLPNLAGSSHGAALVQGRLGLGLNLAGTAAGSATVEPSEEGVRIPRVRAYNILGNATVEWIRTAVVTGNATRSTSVAAVDTPAQRAWDDEPITPLRGIFV